MKRTEKRGAKKKRHEWTFIAHCNFFFTVNGARHSVLHHIMSYSTISSRVLYLRNVLLLHTQCDILSYLCFTMISCHTAGQQCVYVYVCMLRCNGICHNLSLSPLCAAKSRAQFIPKYFILIKMLSNYHKHNHLYYKIVYFFHFRQFFGASLFTEPSGVFTSFQKFEKLVKILFLISASEIFSSASRTKFQTSHVIVSHVIQLQLFILDYLRQSHLNNQTARMSKVLKMEGKEMFKWTLVLRKNLVGTCLALRRNPFLF